MSKSYLDLISIVTEILLKQKEKKEGVHNLNHLLEEKLLTFLIKEALEQKVNIEEPPFKISRSDKNLLTVSDGFVISSDSTLKNPVTLFNNLLKSIEVSGTYDDILDIPVKFYCGNFIEKTFVITTLSFENWNQAVH